ncbi:conjugal transfer protein TraW [Candidatus Tisiphia endosymbiont of Hybos culiciformis]|uniref:conjugal transfer protein TraW n=1 Tax=Candidatus Tisiphia endosymbiont of Hybos culiciformis TaxID=3139331 RepID=UPI003CCA7C53
MRNIIQSQDSLKSLENQKNIDLLYQKVTTFKEEGFVTMIKRKLAGLDLTKHQRQMQDIAKKAINQPRPVAGITRTQKTISYSFAPTYTLDQDVYLPCGRLLHPAGTKVNPLDHMSWDDRLTFIDGTDQDQLTWLKRQYIASEKVEEEIKTSENKIVLVAGKILELSKEIGRQIYFDQFGALTSKFNIKHVPAIVEQQGKYLQITEVNVN